MTLPMRLSYHILVMPIWETLLPGITSITTFFITALFLTAFIIKYHKYYNMNPNYFQIYKKASKVFTTLHSNGGGRVLPQQEGTMTEYWKAKITPISHQNHLPDVDTLMQLLAGSCLSEDPLKPVIPMSAVWGQWQGQSANIILN